MLVPFGCWRECIIRCNVVGGPSYDIKLRGQASDLAYRIDRTHLEFGDVQFDDFAEQDLMIFNKGCVPVSYSVDLRGMGRRVLVVTPETGKICGDGKAGLKIKFLPGESR